MSREEYLIGWGGQWNCTARKVWADFAVYVTEDAIANLYMT